MIEGSVANQTEDQQPVLDLSPADRGKENQKLQTLMQRVIAGEAPVDRLYFQRDAFTGELVPEAINTGRELSNDFFFPDPTFEEIAELSGNFNLFDTTLDYPYRGLQSTLAGDLALSNDPSPRDGPLGMSWTASDEGEENGNFELFDRTSQEPQPIEALEEMDVSFLPSNSSKMDCGGDDSQPYITAYPNGPTPSGIFGSPLFYSAQ
jgi:hypothetical protein